MIKRRQTKRISLHHHGRLVPQQLYFTSYADIGWTWWEQNLRETWGSTLSLSNTDFDQALPIAFSRQNLPDLSGLFQKIDSVGETGEDLLAEIETDSPLLNSKAATRALAIKPCSQRSGK